MNSGVTYRRGLSGWARMIGPGLGAVLMLHIGMNARASMYELSLLDHSYSFNDHDPRGWTMTEGPGAFDGTGGALRVTAVRPFIPFIPDQWTIETMNSGFTNLSRAVSDGGAEVAFEFTVGAGSSIQASTFWFVDTEGTRWEMDPPELSGATNGTHQVTVRFQHSTQWRCTPLAETEANFNNSLGMMATVGLTWLASYPTGAAFAVDNWENRFYLESLYDFEDGLARGWTTNVAPADATFDGESGAISVTAPSGTGTNIGLETAYPAFTTTAYVGTTEYAQVSFDFTVGAGATVQNATFWFEADTAVTTNTYRFADANARGWTKTVGPGDFDGTSGSLHVTADAPALPFFPGQWTIETADAAFTSLATALSRGGGEVGFDFSVGVGSAVQAASFWFEDTDGTRWQTTLSVLANASAGTHPVVVRYQFSDAWSCEQLAENETNFDQSLTMIAKVGVTWMATYPSGADFAVDNWENRYYLQNWQRDLTALVGAGPGTYRISIPYRHDADWAPTMGDNTAAEFDASVAGITKVGVSWNANMTTTTTWAIDNWQSDVFQRFTTIISFR